MSFDLIDRIISREGGAKVTNDPVDPGGVTKFGLSKRANPTLDILNLTYEQAKDVYIQKYYMGHNIHLLPEALQELVTDFGVHSGPQTSIRFLQKLLGQQQDGVIGSATVAAAKLASSEQILPALRRERAIFLAKQIVEKPEKIKYLLGWLNRALSV